MKKIILLLSVFILVFSFTSCGTKEDKKGMDTSEMQNFIVTFFDNFNSTLDTENSTKFTEVGVYQEENMYALNIVPFNEFSKRFTARATDEFIKKEFSVRELYRVKNNIVFTNTEVQQARRKKLNGGITELKELNEFEVTENSPMLAISLNKYIEQNYQNIKFFKVRYPMNETNSILIESIYMIGEDVNGFKLLDCEYYIDGTRFEFFKEHIQEIEIAAFEPLNFDEKTEGVVDLGNQDAIIDREENYQGSKPYYEQNFEENDKVFNQ